MKYDTVTVIYIHNQSIHICQIPSLREGVKNNNFGGHGLPCLQKLREQATKRLHLIERRKQHGGSGHVHKSLWVIYAVPLLFMIIPL